MKKNNSLQPIHCLVGTHIHTNKYSDTSDNDKNLFYDYQSTIHSFQPSLNEVLLYIDIAYKQTFCFMEHDDNGFWSFSLSLSPFMY